MAIGYEPRRTPPASPRGVWTVVAMFLFGGAALGGLFLAARFVSPSATGPAAQPATQPVTPPAP